MPFYFNRFKPGDLATIQNHYQVLVEGEWKLMPELLVVRIRAVFPPGYKYEVEFDNGKVADYFDYDLFPVTEVFQLLYGK